MARELQKHHLVERSLIKKYRKELWNPFIAAVKRYELIQEGDKIAVCISGGKDSMILAMLMKHLQAFSEVPFELVFLCMDPGYNEENRRLIEENAKLLNFPLVTFETDIFSASEEAAGENPCYLCARMRRGHLYAEAKRRGCNKTVRIGVDCGFMALQSIVDTPAFLHAAAVAVDMNIDHIRIQLLKLLHHYLFLLSSLGYCLYYSSPKLLHSRGRL